MSIKQTKLSYHLHLIKLINRKSTYTISILQLKNIKFLLYNNVMGMYRCIIY